MWIFWYIVILTVNNILGILCKITIKITYFTMMVMWCGAALDATFKLPCERDKALRAELSYFSKCPMHALFCRFLKKRIWRISWYLVCLIWHWVPCSYGRLNIAYFTKSVIFEHPLFFIKTIPIFFFFWQDVTPNFLKNLQKFVVSLSLVVGIAFYFD